MRAVDLVGALRAVAALALLGYVPGRIWVAILLPALRSRIERLVASIVLSVSLIVLALYLGNVAARVPVGARAAIGWSVAFTLLGLGMLVAPRVSQRFVIAK